MKAKAARLSRRFSKYAIIDSKLIEVPRQKSASPAGTIIYQTDAPGAKLLSGGRNPRPAITIQPEEKEVTVPFTTAYLHRRPRSPYTESILTTLAEYSTKSKFRLFPYFDNQYYWDNIEGVWKENPAGSGSPITYLDYSNQLAKLDLVWFKGSISYASASWVSALNLESFYPACVYDPEGGVGDTFPSITLGMQDYINVLVTRSYGSVQRSTFEPIEHIVDWSDRYVVGVTNQRDLSKSLPPITWPDKRVSGIETRKVWRRGVYYPGNEQTSPRWVTSHTDGATGRWFWSWDLGVADHGGGGAAFFFEVEVRYSWEGIQPGGSYTPYKTELRGDLCCVDRSTGETVSAEDVEAYHIVYYPITNWADYHIDEYNQLIWTFKGGVYCDIFFRIPLVDANRFMVIEYQETWKIKSIPGFRFEDETASIYLDTATVKVRTADKTFSKLTTVDFNDILNSRFTYDSSDADNLIPSLQPNEKAIFVAGRTPFAAWLADSSLYVLLFKGPVSLVSEQEIYRPRWGSEITFRDWTVDIRVARYQVSGNKANFVGWVSTPCAGQGFCISQPTWEFRTLSDDNGTRASVYNDLPDRFFVNDKNVRLRKIGKPAKSRR